MLSGDNGILQKATDAKTNTDNAQIKERIQLAYHSALAGGQGSYTKESLEAELEKEFGENNYNVDDSDNANWILSAKGQDVTIPAGKIDGKKVTIKVGTSNLKDVSDLSTLYGQTTDYTSVNGVQWQLFYDDDGYIYLIASDYVLGSALPNELLTEGQSTEYCRYFASTTDSFETFTGTIMETAPWSNGTESSSITGNSLTNAYLKWVNSTLATTKTNPNMKAVAYMMDTSKWSNFAGDVKGAYAIGGPTLEMFVRSYNSKHDTKLGTYNTVNETNANENGYMVKIGSGEWSNFTNGLDTSSDNMWVKTNPDKAYGMWLASPASGSNNQIECVYFQGYLIYGYGFINSTAYGFRPLVAIPKSSLK